MPNSKKSPTTGGPEIFRVATTQAIDLLTSRLLKRAKETGGGLTAPDIRGVIDSFKDHPDPILDALYTQSWEKCLTIVNAAQWTSARKFHFERIMVKCFSDLLPGNSERIQAGRHLSRRIIPGFIHALQQMVGPEVYTDYADRTKTLVDTLRAVHGEGFTWNEVYADPSCQDIVEEVLVGIAFHFSDMAKRRNWLIDIVDAHMPNTTSEAERAWVFEDGAFHSLMNALYSDIREKIAAETGRNDLFARYGKETVDAIDLLFDGLGQDHADLMSSGRL